jgi:hypothetical protein
MKWTVMGKKTKCFLLVTWRASKFGTPRDTAVHMLVSDILPQRRTQERVRIFAWKATAFLTGGSTTETIVILTVKPCQLAQEWSTHVIKFYAQLSKQKRRELPILACLRLWCVSSARGPFGTDQSCAVNGNCSLESADVCHVFPTGSGKYGWKQGSNKRTDPKMLQCFHSCLYLQYLLSCVAIVVGFNAPPGSINCPTVRAAFVNNCRRFGCWFLTRNFIFKRIRNWLALL